METQYVREFIALADARSYNDAAARLYTSTSTLFKHIKSLEKELGSTLFEREGKGIRLTNYGALFLDYARKIERLSDEFQQTVKAGADKEIITVWTNYRLSDFAKGFYQLHPEFLLNIIEGNTERSCIERAVRSTDYGLLCLRDATEYMGQLHAEPFLHDRNVLVVYDGHPFAERRSVELSELREEKFIWFSQADTNRLYFMPQWERARFQPDIVMTASRGSDIIGLVAQGLGVSILSEYLVKQTGINGVRTIPVTPESAFDVYIGARKGKELTEGEKLFAEYLLKSGNASQKRRE